MTVYKCPVCEGKGFVCHGFYNSTINYNVKIIPDHQTK